MTFDHQRTLETERLRLRTFSADDEDNIVALDSDPEVLRYINGGTPTPREFVRSKIIPLFTTYDGPFGFWAAIEKASDEFIGWFCLRHTDDPSEAALGYRLRRSAWGKGYATEGGRELVEIAFAAGKRSVMAGTYEHNVRSRRVMEKLGMTLRKRYRATADDIAAGDTFDPGPPVIWDGDDVIYAIGRS